MKRRWYIAVDVKLLDITVRQFWNWRPVREHDNMPPGVAFLAFIFQRTQAGTEIAKFLNGGGSGERQFGAGVDPIAFDAQGGHVMRLDGSTRWYAYGSLTRYATASGSNNYFGRW